jgi:pentatricopeptide repeat protein
MCDVVTYNLMVSGLGKYGIPKQALYYYYEMVSLGIKESPSTFSSVLSICSSQDGFLRQGIQVHCRIIKLGCGSNLFIRTSLVGFYMQMGCFDLGFSLFDEMPERNLATWNLVLRGFCELGRFHELLRVYHEMKLDGVHPNGLSFCYLIRGCRNEKFFYEGKQLHCHIIKVGWARSNIFVANALVDFYSACKSLNDARKSFESNKVEDVISWNSIVSVYADCGLLFEAVELFYLMQFWGKPSIRSFVALLHLSSLNGNILFGKQIHCCVLKMGFDIGSFHVQSALIDMYGKCRYIESSVSAFESVPKKTTQICNSLMTSLLHCGIVYDVVEMYGLMVDEGIGLDEVTFSTTLKALSVSEFASMDSCRLVHCCAMKLGFGSDIAVSCSLIDAYSRCGHVQLSKKVFEQLPSPNVICFTSIINGLAQNGLGRECLQTFEAMIRKGLEPDKVTFLCVLTGCSHSGLFDEGRLIFYSMKAQYGICPAKEHFSCMVDILGRAGLLDEAEELTQKAPGRGDCVMWTSLLRSCRIYRNEIVGRRAAKALLELDPEDFSVYLQVSNFYSDIGEYESSMHIRELAIARKLTREIGRSFIEVNNPHIDWSSVQNKKTEDIRHRL